MHSSSSQPSFSPYLRWSSPNIAPSSEFMAMLLSFALRIRPSSACSFGSTHSNPNLTSQFSGQNKLYTCKVCCSNGSNAAVTRVATSPSFVLDNTCTNTLVADSLGGCVAPFSTFANNFLDLPFTAAFGIVGIDVLLLLSVACLFKTARRRRGSNASMRRAICPFKHIPCHKFPRKAGAETQRVIRLASYDAGLSTKQLWPQEPWS